MLPPKKNKILFVCHMANLSGAPLLLLELVKAVKTATELSFEIIIVTNGPLSKKFEELGPVHYWNPEWTTRYAKPIQFRLNKWRTGRHRKKIARAVSACDTIFLNTITNGQVQNQLLRSKARHICYTHEMNAAIEFATTKNDLAATLKHTDFFIACSYAVKDNLVKTYAVPAKDIRVLRTPIRETINNPERLTAFRRNFKREYTISENAVIIGVVGAGEWRKGFDFFFPLIKIYSELYPTDDVRFVWKGAGASPDFYTQFDLDRFDLKNKAILLPHGSDAPETISCFDIHLLLSREDPYPLVVLESACMQIPTISFDNAGGAPEFIEEDCGFVVPYGNLIRMANSIHELVINKYLRETLGHNAKMKVTARHSFNTAILPFLDLLQQDLPGYFEYKKNTLTIV